MLFLLVVEKNMSTSTEVIAGDINNLLPVEWVSQAEFARRVGCTRQNIYKHVVKGTLVLVNKKLDYQASLLALDAETDEGHHERLGKDTPASESEESVESESVNYKESRAKREHHNEQMAKINLLERSGKLIDAEKVKKDSFLSARILRDSLLSISDRLAPVLAAEQDERSVAQILDEEITKALNSVVTTLTKASNDNAGE